MLQVYRANPYGAEELHAWLESIKPKLVADISNYARGRPRVWLGIEPSLVAGGAEKRGLPITAESKNRLAEIIDWEFDFCLLTFSGQEAIGISPHRDASYADYEARGFNIVGEAKFLYWNDRQSFGRSPSTGVSMHNPPTHEVLLKPGDCIRFNCKNPHASAPQANRWAMNFWRRKP